MWQGMAHAAESFRRCAGGLPAPLDRLRKRWRRGTRQRCRQVRERRWRRRGVENLACYCRTRELTRMGCGELSGRAGVHKLVGWAAWAASCVFGLRLKRVTKLDRAFLGSACWPSEPSFQTWLGRFCYRAEPVRAELKRVSSQAKELVQTFSPRH